MFTLQPNVPMSQTRTRTNGLLRADLYKDAEYQSRATNTYYLFLTLFFPQTV